VAAHHRQGVGYLGPSPVSTDPLAGSKQGGRSRPHRTVAPRRTPRDQDPQPGIGKSGDEAWRFRGRAPVQPGKGGPASPARGHGRGRASTPIGEACTGHWGRDAPPRLPCWIKRLEGLKGHRPFRLAGLPGTPKGGGLARTNPAWLLGMVLLVRQQRWPATPLAWLPSWSARPRENREMADQNRNPAAAPHPMRGRLLDRQRRGAGPPTPSATTSTVLTMETGWSPRNAG